MLGINQEMPQILIRNTRTIIFLLGIICAILAGYILIEMKTVIVPFALALIISFILNPIIVFFEKKHIPEGISILVVLVLTFAILFLVGQLININVKSFLADVNQYEAKYHSFKQNFLEIISIAEGDYTDSLKSREYPAISAIIQNTSIKSLVTAILGSVSSILSDTFLVLLYLLFLLLSRNRLVHKLDIAFKSDTSSTLKEIVKTITTQINKYVITKTWISLLTASMVTLVLWLFGVEFAFIWGLLTFLLNFIPNIGSIFATLFPAVFAFVQFDTLMPVIWVTLCLFLIQFLVGNVIEPKIIGKSMGISPIVVLFSLMFWGYAWGIIGMILAVPFAVLIKIIMDNISGLKPIGVLISDYK